MFRAKQGDPLKLVHRRRLRAEMTLAEKKLWYRISSRQLHFLKFRRQHGIGPYIVDFYCPEKGMIIELDGDTHADEHQKIIDWEREKYLRSLGLCVLRYTNQEILENLEEVLEDLSQKLLKKSTSPYPSLQRRGMKNTKEGEKETFLLIN